MEPLGRHGCKRSMRPTPRTNCLAAGALAVLILIASESPAAGGGGCGKPPTAGDGTTVRMFHACMTPTVLRTGAGGTVTFVNDDDFPHNVTSSSFFEELPRRGDAVELAFTEPGVYPYSCTLHPGMTGAVVVGDGIGVASTKPVVVEPADSERVEPSLISTSDRPKNDVGDSPGTIATPIAAIGALVLTAASGALGRASVRRRPSRA